MSWKCTRELRLDPRTGLILLVLSNIVAFTQESILVGNIWIGVLAILLLCCGCGKAAIKYVVVLIILLSLQYYIFPVAPKFLVTTFSIFINYSHKMFPCLMVSTLLIKKTSIRELVLAMRKCHIPERFIIPLSVTLRYFPTIREEAGYILDAMKLRRISTFKKLECIIVPLMISATTTAEELSAAAVTRGIENPVKKTSAIKLHFGIADILCIIGGSTFVVFTILIR